MTPKQIEELRILGMRADHMTVEEGVKFGHLIRESWPDIIAALLRDAAPTEARLSDVRLSELAKRVIDYDEAIESCGSDPARMVSFCTAQGVDLDTLYFMMVDAAEAIKRDEAAPSPRGEPTLQATVICSNCGTRMPEGCGGQFRKDGHACLLNRPEPQRGDTK